MARVRARARVRATVKADLCDDMDILMFHGEATKTFKYIDSRFNNQYSRFNGE